MIGGKYYSYFSYGVLEDMYEALKALDEPGRLMEVCRDISEARGEWFVDSQALSTSGIDKLHDIFMQQLMDEHGKIELFGEEFWADDLYERVYGEDHIKTVILEQFTERLLKLPNAESWQTIMDKWSEVQAMATSVLSDEGLFSYDDIQTAMDKVVDLFNAYYGWD